MIARARALTSYTSSLSTMRLSNAIRRSPRQTS
jgi:hypothetical protein